MRYPRRASLGYYPSATASHQPIKSERRHTTQNEVSIQREKPSVAHLFHVRQQVLARWIDGLLYLGKIVKVDDKQKRCYIKFEDDSEHWARFKDIQKGRTRGEISCVLCHGGKSVKPNEIVLCDHCGLGYHQQCHQPHIGKQMLKAGIRWFCRQCVFAATAKVGGAFKTGLNARAMQAMKLSLPYKLSDLMWDSHHKTNEEECYCYCSGPGEWYLKMLQCCRCGQWFHEACLQCLDKPLVYGDRFYVFVCSCCNQGPEYIKRLEVPLIDAVHLCLFNVTIEHNHKYYDFDMDIFPWMERYWARLHLGEVQAMPETRRRERVFQALMSNKVRFQNGREIKKSRNLWALRVRLPPTGPTIELPKDGQITARVVNNIQLKWPKRSSVDKHIRLCRKRSASFRSCKRRSSCELKNFSKRARYISSIDLTSNVDEACVNNSQDYGGYKGDAQCYDVSSKCSENNDRKARKSGVKPKSKTLESKIPPVGDYEGTNHPFRTVLECNMAIERQKRKEELLKTLTRKQVDGEVAVFTETKTFSIHEIAPARRHRGRKSKAECLLGSDQWKQWS
ncbi:hypothetical protein NP493_949g00057 [Ridgeia piscesae]|uniref:PHD-type domain-containing protein n=1 Tax=Ridgeia piscesae TaxID=27915 RepID=A0AAD9KKX5_RIDPI|nr:hypothetical protein NP493_949g00057 [Ridgeia piscesae]